MKKIICKNCGHKIDLQSELLTTISGSAKSEIKNDAVSEFKNSDEYLKLLEMSSLDKEVKVKEVVVEDTTTKMQLIEKIDIISQLTKQIDSLQDKIKHTDNRQQGEAQELMIEEFLRKTFPLDTITEIKKGQPGADTLQVINTRDNINVGSIYYESKNTKNFNNAWIDKFKQDLLNKKVNVGILVSKTRPTGVNRASLIKGIWVCTFDEFKVISQTIRDSLINISNAIELNKNKKEKTNMLYDYLSSNEFKQQIESIVDGFVQMQNDLNSEKRAMQAIWNKREKAIIKVIDSTSGMYGSIKGIGIDVEIKQIEL
jgi:hypothetical protein